MGTFTNSSRRAWYFFQGHEGSHGGRDVPTLTRAVCVLPAEHVRYGISQTAHANISLRTLQNIQTATEQHHDQGASGSVKSESEGLEARLD